MTDNRTINIIEDHALICNFLDCMVCAIENGSALPNYVPVLNDTLMTDHLGKISETIDNLRKKLL